MDVRILTVVVDSVESAVEHHMASVAAQGDGGTPPCLESDVDCNGSIITVVTCCNPGETLIDCLARHRVRVQAVEDACA